MEHPILGTSEHQLLRANSGEGFHRLAFHIALRLCKKVEMQVHAKSA